jgi:spore maturation protein CgeB
MKILLLTPVHPLLPKKNPLPQFQTQNYWLIALKKLKLKTKVFRYTDKIFYPATKLDRKFPLFSLEFSQRAKIAVNLAEKFKPDYIFYSAGESGITSLTIKKLSQIAPVILFHGTEPNKYANLEDKKSAPFFNLIVTNDPQHTKNWLDLGARKSICLPFSAVDPKVFKPDKNKKKSIDINFVGSLFPQRQNTLKKLINQAINLKIWGWLPPKTKLLQSLKAHYQGEAWGNQVVNIYQRSKIALNLVPDHMTDGGNLRTFEIPATNCLQLIDKINPSYYLPNKEIVVFNSPQDAKKKVDFYLKFNQKRYLISKKGYQKTIKNHTFAKRFKKLFNYV